MLVNLSGMPGQFWWKPWSVFAEYTSDIESISAITYGVQIPDEYMLDVLKSLLQKYGDSSCSRKNDT